MALTLVLVESALQLVPNEILSHPQIKHYAKKRRKAADEILLDRSFHHSAMQRLARMPYPIPADKMGRPDIVHNTLLQVLETPLNWEGLLRVFVHTQDEHVISINPKVRLPKNYIRFIGLIEQLFAKKRVPKEGEPLLRIERMSLQQLATICGPTEVLGFSTQGKPAFIRDVAEFASTLKSPLTFIGGFPRGHFTEKTKQLVKETFSVDKRPLDAWVVAGRFVYDFEWSIGLAKTRLKIQKPM